MIARRLPSKRGLLPRKVGRAHQLMERLNLEGLLLFAVAIVLVGGAGVLACFISWSNVDFGNLDFRTVARPLTFSMTAIAVGVQVALAAFLMSLLDLDAKQ